MNSFLFAILVAAAFSMAIVGITISYRGFRYATAVALVSFIFLLPLWFIAYLLQGISFALRSGF
ncbi:MAG: hypothetical protein A3F24_00150 [Candidatus Colwellbacteria bacterium RIFCSPHIGHO2_12_FULL_44_17]|uniref:Uncharacterized protein n=2 Tax=Candidatus Colwelliibacteriota TaxID=1817904 RepID=A0A1G1Z4H0_9BACT|nr:MAG: hypothetical protein A3I31_02220 [Candidatus Colwellbacteria bacterium RIFCSPLOWO2_02_FULL_44_20b]OGY59882.1 MAG: hypothetical protein A3F24_00150 [Candidatus Colwellbacteria bacterium RIFCSPHIGHO2_12_FULL_44_17]